MLERLLITGARSRGEHAGSSNADKAPPCAEELHEDLKAQMMLDAEGSKQDSTPTQPPGPDNSSKALMMNLPFAPAQSLTPEQSVVDVALQSSIGSLGQVIDAGN